MAMTLNLNAYKHQTTVVLVKDFADASDQFRAWIEKHDLGASDLRRSAGDIVENGQRIAYVSYNGRVWNVNGQPLEV